MMDFITAINNVIWAEPVLYAVLATGVLFTVWSGFCQYRALTHGVAVTRGKYDNPDDPGAINHFQALSAALSATVGLGNIGGVALAIGLGGPGAVFWMWVVGAVGMALKTTEVTLAMLYRNTDDPDNPHGGAMWVVSKGIAKWKPSLAWLGKLIGGIFCVTLLVSAITGGNMFQSWNVADLTHHYFGVPQIATGIVLAVLVGMVIIGGIKRIGAVAGRLVPAMCAMYLVAAVYVLILKIDVVPAMLVLIVKSAFSPLEAQGAFIGGTLGYAFLWGMKRALFSNEAGQGSAPIAHSAAKTSEPVREAVVSGLEPFIDTVVVCTMTALVLVITGAYEPTAEVFGAQTAADMTGFIAQNKGAALTSMAMGSQISWFPWVLSVAVVMFAYSTMISWSYYGEQGIYFLFKFVKKESMGNVVLLYKLIYCVLVAVSTLPFIKTDAELDMWTTLGLGVMLVANIPIMLLFGSQAMKAYHEYNRKLKAGEFDEN